MAGIGELGSIGTSNTMDIIFITVGAIVAVAEAARRITQKIPGKTGDEISGRIEKYARLLLDFLAGFHGEHDDPTAVKPDKKK